MDVHASGIIYNAIDNCATISLKDDYWSMDDTVDDTDRVIHVITLLKWLKKRSIYNYTALQMVWYLQYLQEALS